jgi:hypothetical protein
MFNIFINDFFDNMPYPEVIIMRGARKKPTLPHMGLAGLLFADDALGLASSLEETCLLCNHITAWTETNEMKVGITKCEIMEWGSKGYQDYSAVFLLPGDAAFDDWLRIGGQCVPVVDKYFYLGVMITRSLETKNLLTLCLVLCG